MAVHLDEEKGGMATRTNSHNSGDSELQLKHR